MQSISTRFDDDTLIRLDEAASAMNQPRSSIIKEAVQRYLDYISWYQDEVTKGVEDFQAGRTRSHDQVKARVKELGYDAD